MKQYILYFNLSDSYCQILLPTENDRNYTLELSEYLPVPPCRMQLELLDGAWRMLQTNEIRLAADDDAGAASMRLSTRAPVCGFFRSSGKPFSAWLREGSPQELQFEKFVIGGKSRITTGKSEQADVCLDSPYISREHFILTRNPDGWVIEDRSRNGVYLDGRRLPSRKGVQLAPFSHIYTGGFHLVFLGDLLAVNCAELVIVKLPRYRAPETSPAQDGGPHEAFLRSPRFFEPLPDDEIVIEAPPQKQTRKKQPMLFVLGPALTMPLPMLTTMLLRMGNGGAGGYWIMGVSVVMSALIGLGWSLARRKYDAKEDAAEESARQTAYTAYLEKNEALLRKRQTVCRERLLRQYPSTAELFEKLTGGQAAESLWNRNIRAEDFLTVRLGLGRMDISGMIKTPAVRFSVRSDALEERPGQLKAEYQTILQTPALLPIARHKVTGVIGEPARVQNVVNNIILQLVALHSYTDVRLMGLFRETELEQFGWMRWLPHTFSPDRSHRLLAAADAAHQAALGYLLDVFRSRAPDHTDAEERPLPVYVVLCTDPKILYNHAVYRYLTDGVNYQVYFLLAYGHMEFLPNECRYLIQADDSFSGAFRMDENRSETDVVTFDRVPAELAVQMARQLSRYWVNELSDGEIPNQIGFLEMLHITNIRDWDLLKQWKTHRAYESIRAQIGVSYGAQPVYLDIHEKQHGPHGLIAGTTGSGKSELIQTFILSLMLQYHPDEVAFILIDYKGGGMANLFGGTPHVAGVITNISTSDGSGQPGAGSDQTQRALLSLKSEIRRRQKIFNDFAVNHIDQYSRLYRQGAAAEPLPHLIIISDEFAELKKEQPAFIKELVSTARVGRSLGVHLILATQKPSGVVDDEIWSNARFKLCLKVQDRQDSMEMLKRPEAAALTRIGRGYMQIGNDELFELFQSGYSGAEYQPELEAEELQLRAVEFIGLDGTRIRRAAQRAPGAQSVSQLDACVAYISETAQRASVRPARKLWLPVLQSTITLETLSDDAPAEPYTAVLGRIDYPEQQMQPLFTLRFPRCGNVLIVGGAGSGKSTLVQTILYALCTRQTPEQLNWYALDCSNHRLDALRATAHCGAIVYPEEEEKVSRLFSQLTELLQTRRRALADASAADAEVFRASGAGLMPLTLVVIDNYAGFMESCERFAEPLLKILRDGMACGIQFIVTMNTPMDMRSRWSQCFATAIPLMLTERADYYNYLGTTPQMMPTGEPGSGLSVYNGSIVQFQSAYVSDLASYTALARPSQTGYRAPQLRYIDKQELYAAYLRQEAVRALPADTLPLGWYTRSIRPYALRLWQTFCYFISDVSGAGARAAEANILRCAAEKQLECHIVCASAAVELNPRFRYYSSYEEVLSLMTYLRDLFKRRAAARREYIAANGADGCEAYLRETFQPVLVLFEDYNAFCAMSYAPGDRISYTEVWETLLKNGKGFGVVFAAIWNKALYQQNFARPACQLFAAYQTGVHLGGKLDAQRVIEPGLSITELTKTRAPESGFALEGAAVSEAFFPRAAAPAEEL